MGKENMKEPVPRDLSPMPFLGHLKEQMGSPYRTRETVCMIGNPKKIHNVKAQEDEGDMDVGWDITSKDVERWRQFLTPTIHTLPNLKPVVQPYIPLGPVHDKDKIVREKEQDYDDSVMQPLTPQTIHITPPDDDYVAPATNPMSNKQLNKFEEEFSNVTKAAEKEYDNPVIKTYNCKTFIRKLLHQVSQSSREMKSQQQYGSNLSFPYPVANHGDPVARRHLSRPARPIIMWYGYSSVGRFDVFFRNQLLVFQQHQDESLYDSWTRFKDIIRKVPNHGLSIWTLIEIFLKHLDSLSRHIINLTVEGDLRKFSDIGAWVQVPRCMAWLDYDEHVDSLSTMDNEVGVTSPESTIQTLLSFEEYTRLVTYPEEIEKTLGTPIEVEPLNETKLEEVGLNCNHNTPFSSRMEVVDYLTTQTPPSPHMANSHPKGVYSYYNPGIDDPKRHYGFKLGLLGKSVSLGVNISNWEMFDDDWGLESKEVSPLGEELSLFDKPNKVERGRILEAHHLESILQQ
ncbi:hypothetical protein Tco_0032540 [Tanacetum coccineum]